MRPGSTVAPARSAPFLKQAHPMKVAVAQEKFPGERRVALVPAAVAPLKKAAGFSDDAYRAAGAEIVSRDEAFAADCLLTVRTCGANGDAWHADRDRLRPGQIVIGMCDPLSEAAACREAADRGVTLRQLAARHGLTALGEQAERVLARRPGSLRQQVTCRCRGEGQCCILARY